jgi:general secretion pathway protein B
MSYILEALRKADAERERERGSVPDLHAQLLPPGVSDVEVVPARSSALFWLGLGVLLAAVAGGVWLALGGDEPAAPPPASTAAAAVTPPPAPAPVARVEAPAPPAPPQPLPPQAQSEPHVAPPPPKAIAKAKPPAAASAPARKAAALAAKDVAPGPKAAAPAPKAEPPASPVRVPALAELPGDLRQQVPALVIGGSVYSPQASARMVVVNGQVFQEGSSLAPELKLEQIRQKTAVFSIRGQRFEVPL